MAQQTVILRVESCIVEMTGCALRSVVVQRPIRTVPAMMGCLCMTYFTDSIVYCIAVCIAVCSSLCRKYYASCANRTPDELKVRLRPHRIMALNTLGI